MDASKIADELIEGAGYVLLEGVVSREEAARARQEILAQVESANAGSGTPYDARGSRNQFSHALRRACTGCSANNSPKTSSNTSYPSATKNDCPSPT